MKIRLTGTVSEVAAAVERIGQVLDVLDTSGHYPNRGTTAVVRVYLEVRLPGTDNGRSTR